MNEIDWRVLAVLAETPNGARFHDPDEVNSLQAMAIYIERPVSDIYEMPDGSFTGRITEAGLRELRKRSMHT